MKISVEWSKQDKYPKLQLTAVLSNESTAMDVVWTLIGLMVALGYHWDSIMTAMSEITEGSKE